MSTLITTCPNTIISVAHQATAGHSRVCVQGRWCTIISVAQQATATVWAGGGGVRNHPRTGLRSWMQRFAHTGRGSYLYCVVPSARGWGVNPIACFPRARAPQVIAVDVEAAQEAQLTSRHAEAPEWRYTRW